MGTGARLSPSWFCAVGAGRSVRLSAFRDRFHAGANCQRRGAAWGRASLREPPPPLRNAPARPGRSFFGAQSQGPADRLRP